MPAYYNEHDPYAAQWLRNLIAAGHITPGDVDGRDIRDVCPADLAGYTQCHFFAGIGIWSAALRGAGWPDDLQVWSGSCPCQPFSSAGRGSGVADDRHLWPYFHYLIQECAPAVVFGEQVSSKDGLGWLDAVQADLEATGYATAALDTCAAGVGAPHIRQRLYFAAERLADRDRVGWNRRYVEARSQRWAIAQGYGDSSGLGHSDSQHTGRNARASVAAQGVDFGGPERDGSRASSATRDLGHSNSQELPSITSLRGGQIAPSTRDAAPSDPGPTNGFWRDPDWLLCRDAKWRPVESGAFPLAHGHPNRVGKLRAYGNAIVAPQAQAFVESYIQTILH